MEVTIIILILQKRRLRAEVKSLPWGYLGSGVWTPGTGTPESASFITSMPSALHPSVYADFLKMNSQTQRQFQGSEPIFKALYAYENISVQIRSCQSTVLLAGVVCECTFSWILKKWIQMFCFVLNTSNNIVNWEKEMLLLSQIGFLRESQNFGVERDINILSFCLCNWQTRKAWCLEFMGACASCYRHAEF